MVQNDPPAEINVVANPQPWQNVIDKYDTNADGQVVPLDVLRVFNQLNEPTILESGGQLPRSRLENSTQPFFDVNGDGFCTTNDALRIVNYLNSVVGEGEAAPVADGAISQGWLFVPSQFDDRSGYASRIVVAPGVYARSCYGNGSTCADEFAAATQCILVLQACGRVP